MRNSLKLILVAIIGSAAGCVIVDKFILPINFMQYLLIEVIVTLTHFMYQGVKKELQNK
jgi:hypothetical protein